MRACGSIAALPETIGSIRVSNDRFEDLEVRIAYQDQLLHELNEVVTRQQASITALQQRCDLLVERIRAMGEAGADAPRDERPPHY